MKNPLYNRFLGKAFSIAAVAALVTSPLAGAQGTTSSSSTDVDFTGGVRTNIIPADQLLSQGKYADAEDMYRQALVNNPSDMLATAGLGMALAKQFKLDGADDMFDRVLLNDPNNAMAHAGKATVALNRLQSSSGTIRGQKDSLLKYAEDEARKAVQLAPANAEAHYALGCVLREQGQNDAAASEFRTATSLDPKHSYAFSGLGRIQLEQGSVAQAAENLRRAVELNSGNSTAHWGLGVALFQQGLTDEAIKELNTSLYQFPNSAPVHMALGDAYDKQGNTAAAIKEYQVAITIKPEIPDPYLKLAGIRESRGDLELALADLRSGLAQMPYNVDLRMRIADELLKLEKSDDAIKSYKTILTMRANDPQAIKGLTQALCIKAQKAAAGALLASNDYDSAMNTLGEAIKLNPNDMELRLAQAKLMAMAGAKTDLTQIPQPQNDGERMSYASALMTQGNFQQAEAMVSDVVSRLNDPKQSFAVADLALMMDDLDNAEVAYKKAQAQGGVQARVDRGLAEITKGRQRALDDVRVANELNKKKQFDGANERYRDAIATNPRLADAHLGLAQNLEKSPKPTSSVLREAAQQYQLYVALQTTLADKDKQKIVDNAQKLMQKADKLALKEPKAPVAVGAGTR